MTEMPTITSASDLKAIIILSCCDLIEQLQDRGDLAGAHALVALVQTIEVIPTK